MTLYQGVPWASCLPKLLLGSYPSSYPSATIGGWTSTGGIGVGTYKYGGAADNIRDMEVVMPDGTIVNTGFKGVCDNMTGYNLTRIISGAEGTLAGTYVSHNGVHGVVIREGANPTLRGNQIHHKSRFERNRPEPIFRGLRDLRVSRQGVEQGLGGG